MESVGVKGRMLKRKPSDDKSSARFLCQIQKGERNSMLSLIYLFHDFYLEKLGLFLYFSNQRLYNKRDC